MSSLHRGDDDLHYSDSSHRWIAPSDVEQDFWEAELAAHLEEHRANMGGPPGPARPTSCVRRPPPASTARPAQFVSDTRSRGRSALP